MNVPEGIYSIAATSIGGASLLVLKIAEGKVTGNDTSGSRYEGTIVDIGSGNVQVDLSVKFPPNTFGIWGTTPTETFQTRSFSQVIPSAVFTSGQPFSMPSFGMTLIAVPIPEEYGMLAGQSGLAAYIEALQAVQKAWETQ